MQANTLKEFSLDRSRNAICFERNMSGSVEDVFSAWTDPRQVESWWDPTGSPLEKCDIELRVGGTFSFVTQARPDLPFTGTYREIKRPDLLVFDAVGAEGRVSLRDEGGQTHMTVEIVCSDAEHLQQFVDMGAANGTSKTLNNLVSYMQQKRS